MSAILSKMIGSLCIFAATAIPALAAAENRNNTTEPIVWGFLGLCALIVIAQIAPLLRNLLKQPKIEARQAQTVKQHHVS